MLAAEALGLCVWLGLSHGGPLMQSPGLPGVQSKCRENRKNRKIANKFAESKTKKWQSKTGRWGRSREMWAAVGIRGAVKSRGKRIGRDCVRLGKIGFCTFCGWLSQVRGVARKLPDWAGRGPGPGRAGWACGARRHVAAGRLWAWGGRGTMPAVRSWAL